MRVHVAKSPVLVIPNPQVVELARSVSRMALAPVEARVQQADVEHPWLRHRETGGKVFLDVLLAEALAVDGDL